LRTTEFFWQEGHTAHATHQEALDETLMMLEEYVNLAQNYLAIPVIKGRKTKHEQFPGAEATYTFEAFLMDGKALQMGTSHLLSQSFAHAFDMKFQDKEGNLAYPYLTSWGTTTRLVGALIGSHGDDRGLILPPKIAPIQVVIVPILKKDTKDAVLDYVYNLAQQLKQAGILVKIDADDTQTPGAKFYEWELKGVPLRFEIAVSRLGKEKETVSVDGIAVWTQQKLQEIQDELFAVAQRRYATMWKKEEALSDFAQNLVENNGIYQVGWCQNHDCEVMLKEYAASIRCMIESKDLSKCFGCQKPSLGDVIVGRAY
jgi:prolyl-tRNA synthetase